MKADSGNVSTITYPNGYYILIVLSGTNTITVTAPDFHTRSLSDVVVQAEVDTNLEIKLFSLLALKGDINGDNHIDLADAIVALRVLIGFDISDKIRPDYATSDSDINGNYKLEMEELLFILQEVSGLR